MRIGRVLHHTLLGVGLIGLLGLGGGCDSGTGEAPLPVVPAGQVKPDDEIRRSMANEKPKRPDGTLYKPGVPIKEQPAEKAK